MPERLDLMAPSFDSIAPSSLDHDMKFFKLEISPFCLKLSFLDGLDLMAPANQAKSRQIVSSLNKLEMRHFCLKLPFCSIIDSDIKSRL